MSTGQSRNCLCFDRTIKLKSHCGKGIGFSTHKKVSFCPKSIWYWKKSFTKTVQIQLHKMPSLDHTLWQQIALCVLRNFEKISVAATSRTKLNQIEFELFVAAIIFWCRDTDFYQNSPVHKKQSVAATSHVGQLVTRPVHKEWFVAVICCLVCPNHDVHQEPGRKWPENLAVFFTL